MSQPPTRTHRRAWDGELPSDRAQELIRQATTLLISDAEAMFETVDEAVLSTQPGSILADPELTDAIRAANRSNLAHWAASNLSRPGWPVNTNTSDETTTGLARLIAQRGIEDTSRVSYGAGQNAAWPIWMRAVFSVTADAGELQEVLDFSARSVFDFVERMLELLREEIERARGHVLSSANARRLALIVRILDGGISTAGDDARAVMQELRYPVDLFQQTAAVLTLRNGSEQLLTVIQAVGEAIGPRLRRRPLAVVSDADTVWAWFPSDVLDRPLDTDLERAFVPRLPEGARVAIGPTRDGFDGFRVGHADALAAADVARTDVVTYNAVAMAALVRAEPQRVREFISARIGAIDEDEKATLTAYLQNRCSPSKTAAATYSHRNTVIDRVRRAETLLRVPIEGHELELGLALELDRFFGSRR